MSSNENSITKEQTLAITMRLDAIIRLLILSLPESITQTKKIQTLSEIGLQPKEIATLVGTTRNTVNVTLSQLRKMPLSTEPITTDHIQ